MIVKAIKTYKDKYTGGAIAAGVLLDMEPERVEELNAAPGGPYVEAYALVVPAKEAKPETITVGEREEAESEAATTYPTAEGKESKKRGG